MIRCVARRALFDSNPSVSIPLRLSRAARSARTDANTNTQLPPPPLPQAKTTIRKEVVEVEKKVVVEKIKEVVTGVSEEDLKKLHEMMAAEKDKLRSQAEADMEQLLERRKETDEERELLRDQASAPPLLSLVSLVRVGRARNGERVARESARR
jgi:hypothetical protein